LVALEDRLDIELRFGRHQAAVVELEELVAVHPLRDDCTRGTGAGHWRV